MCRDLKRVRHQDCCADEVGAKVIIRFLRAVADFEYEYEYEYEMVSMKRAMNDQIETMFLMAEAQNQAVVSKPVTPRVKTALMAKLGKV